MKMKFPFIFEVGLIAISITKFLTDAYLMNAAIVKTNALRTGLGENNSFGSGQARIQVEP